MSSAIKIRLWLNSSLSFGARRTSEAAVTNSKESCITIYCLLASKAAARVSLSLAFSDVDISPLALGFGHV